METFRGCCSPRYNRLFQQPSYRLMTRRQCLLVLFLLLILQLAIFNFSCCLFHFKGMKDYMRIGGAVVSNEKKGVLNSDEAINETVSYKYPMIDSSNDVVMDYNSYNGSSYKWFMGKKNKFSNVGEEDTRKYPKDTATCVLDTSILGPIDVQKKDLELDWVEKQYPDVNHGGYYAPANCRAPYKVAIIVPYRDRKHHLNIFLYYIHGLLKKQLVEYRIFVVEQFGTNMWNKGTLYNIAYLETQRFGTWDCLIFHDVDTIPEHEGIIYSCTNSPMLLSTVVEINNYTVGFWYMFGGVTALTPLQFESVNGYSNMYWEWGPLDKDMALRLTNADYTVFRYNESVARYASLPHKRVHKGKERIILMNLSNRFKIYTLEGLRTTTYNLISVKKNKLYTHLLADVNPNKIKVTPKSLIDHMIHIYGKSMKLRTIVSNLLHFYREFWIKKDVHSNETTEENHMKTLRISSARQRI